MTAAIFTIGTEITDGQIIDRNSQWMSERLTDFGIDVLLHASMPDDQKQIVDFLKTIAGSFDILIFSGGLGPTSDDLTRFAAAQYFGLDLELDIPSWIAIQNRLSSKNVTIREEHKQQAMILKGSRALSNSAGSAPGMHLSLNNKNVFLLPGPPVELQAIWDDHVAPVFKAMNIQNDRKLKKWLCHGIAESDLAHITDSFFKDKTFVIKTGFRLQRPQVEAKVWYTETPDSSSAFQEFEKLIEKFLVSDSAI